MTNNVVEAVVHIEGTRPLLWHAFTPDAIPLERKEKTGVAGNDPVEWQRTVLVDQGTRLLYIPGTYAFSCIKEGGKYIKKGRSSYQPIIIATLLVLDDAIFIDDRRLPELPTTDPDQPVYLDVRGVRNPATRGMNVRYRIACRSGWTCAFRLRWDRSLIATELLESILNDAGQFAGIGSGRAIGMGRFQLKAFEVLNGS
jgi:hypothetical protein